MFISTGKAEIGDPSFQDSSDTCISTFSYYSKKIITGEISTCSSISCFKVDVLEVSISKFFDVVLAKKSERLTAYYYLCDILDSVNMDETPFIRELKRHILFKENNTLLNFNKYSLQCNNYITESYKNEESLFFLNMLVACKYESYSAYANMYYILSHLMLYSNNNSVLGNCILEAIRDRLESTDKNILDDNDLLYIKDYYSKNYIVNSEKKLFFGEGVIYRNQ